MEYTSAEMSPVARQANMGKVGGRKSEEQLGIALGVPQHRQPCLHKITDATDHTTHTFATTGMGNYRPRSRGNNMFGSVHVCVRLFVCGRSPV